MHFKKINLNAFLDTSKPITDISSDKVVVAHEKANLNEIIDILLKEKIRKIPVVDDLQSLKGMTSSIDVLDVLGAGDKKGLLKKHKKPLSMGAEKFMTRHIRAIHHKTSIKKSLQRFQRGETGLYPVTDSNKLVSVVAEWDFVKHINRKTGIDVDEVMVERPLFARKTYNVYDVSKMMCRGGYRRLPVVEDNILLGIVTPTDILLHLRKKGTEDKLGFDRTRIESVMNKNLITVEGDEDLFYAVKLMRNQSVGGLPVTDDDELIGVVTERDIVDALICGRRKR